MSSTERDRILDHDYDGIREYDNPLPGWWINTFYGCIAWGVAYFLFQHVGPGLSDTQSHERAERAAGRKAVSALILSGASTEETLAAFSRHDLAMNHAAKVWSRDCAGCHGQQGEGRSGPNLTDDAWIHGGSLTDIHRVIRDGVTTAGMSPGFFTLRSDEMYALTAHVGSLRGTNPPGARGPEGTAWSPAIAAASNSEREAMGEQILSMASDPARVEAGASLFATRCVACHGMKGEGGIGPNLTDDYWIHGNRAGDIYTTISEGVVSKGMLAWKNQLSADEMRELASFVVTLRGTNPPNPRPPQGVMSAGIGSSAGDP